MAVAFVLLLLFLFYFFFDFSENTYLAFTLPVLKEPGHVYRNIIRYMSWPHIERY